MFTSIFRKQIVVYMGTLFISFGLLALVMSQVIRSYFTDQRVKALLDSAGKLAEQIQTYGVIGNMQLNSEGRILNKYMNASLLIVNNQFAIIWASNDISAHVEGVTINLNERQNLMNAETVIIKGGLGNIYPEQKLTVGYPIIIDGEFSGAILMNSSMPELEKTIWDMYRTILLSLAVIGGFAFLMVYISSRTISRPLHQMNEAAKVIADGDFEKRIAVKSKDEVGQLAQSFNDMAESLEQQEKKRREFITNISHDLRSPLTSMKGFLQAVADGTVPPEKQNYYIGIVLVETERLSKLANDILDLNTIQAKGPELYKTKFDINKLIRETMLIFEQRIVEKRIRAGVNLADEEDMVEADYEKIKRVIDNLMDNAVKFTPEEGEIKLETTVKEGKVFVSVCDNGRGVAPENQKRIFERFVKVDASRGEDTKGSGLGLSIVREFMKAHGETVTLESEVGKGCRFMFSLPLAEEER